MADQPLIPLHFLHLKKNDISDEEFLGLGIPITEFFVRSGLAKSRREARQFIKDGACKINDIKIEDHNARFKWEVIDNTDHGFIISRDEE